MRASLASATSLLALLLMEGHEAKARPQVTVGSTINFGDVLVGGSGTLTNRTWTLNGQTSGDHLSISSAASPFSGAGLYTTVGSGTPTDTVSYNFSPSARGAVSDTLVGSDTSRTSTAASLTLTGTGVAPVANGPGTVANVSGYYLVNSSQTGTVTLTVSNSGDAYLLEASSHRTVNNTSYNLNGTISGGTSVFVGTASSISLQDSNYTGSGKATSATYSYTFAPTVKGVNTASVTTSFTDGSSVNGASTVVTTLSGTGVAPVASISSGSNAGYVLVGATKSVTVTVANTGNGNLAGTGTAFNANGSIAALSSVSGFSGSASSIGLASNATGSTASTATRSVSYTYAPTVTGTSSALVVASMSNASADGTNRAASLTSTLTGTGVAPVASIAGSASAGYVLVGQSTTTSFSIGNVGNGNLAGTGTAYNLNGSIGSLSSNGFSGSASSIGLASNATGSTTSTASTGSPTYTYKPTTIGSSSALVVETLSNGSTNGQNQASNQTTTLTGTGVAPVASVGNSTVYARIGAGSVTGTITVANTGNGNLAGSGTPYNLNGSIGAFSSGSFSGGASSISLASNATGSTASTASTALNYTYTPGASRSSSSTSVGIAFSNGNSAGTNASQTVTSVLTGSAVSPTYASTLAGKTVANTPTATGFGSSVSSAVGPTISFGTVSYKTATTLFLDLGNVTNDGGDASLTNLTIDKFSISGGNAADFAVSSVGSVITEGGTLVVPITVTSDTTTLNSLLSSSLTIFTDEGTGLGGYGENFTYTLTALSVPEPASLAVLGAGLAGLASFRRRKRGGQ